MAFLKNYFNVIFIFITETCVVSDNYSPSKIEHKSKSNRDFLFS